MANAPEGLHDGAMTTRYYEPLIGQPLPLAVFDELKRIACRLHPEWQLEAREVEPGEVEVTIRSVPGLKISLHNLARKLVAAATQGEELALFRKFVENIAEVVGQRGAAGDTLGEVSGSLFLAVRPTGLPEQARASGMAHAFEWPVTPDLSVFWGLDMGSGFSYVTKEQFDTWGATTETVTEIAYKNSVKEEAELEVSRVGDDGLILEATSRFETVGHLLYWLPSLARLIEKHAPGLSSGPLLLNVPSWKHLVVVRRAHHPLIPFLHAEHFGGDVLSSETYVLAGAALTGKLADTSGKQLVALGLDAWGLGPGDKRIWPYRPS